jgi:hypothetical protein
MNHFYHTVDPKKNDRHGRPQSGFFNYPQLYSRLVADMPENGVFVEVGVWKGTSLAYFIVEAINANKNLKIFAVDTWAGDPKEIDLINHDPSVVAGTLYQEFLHNLSPVANTFTPLQMTSLEAASLFADASIDAMFIDALHDYASVKDDLHAWYPKVKSGGYLCGHDYYSTRSVETPHMGVRRAVDEFYKDKQHEIVKFGREYSWITKKS